MEIKRNNKSLWYVTLVAVFFAVFDLAASYSFFIFDSLCLAVAGLLIIYWFNACHLNTVCIWKKVFTSRGLGGILAILLGFYILWDLAGVLYSPVADIALKKYPAVMVGILIGASLLSCVNSQPDGNLLIGTIAVGGSFTAVFSVLNYTLLHIYPSNYALRITLRRDYNVFATVVFIGLLAGLYIVFSGRIRDISKYIWFFALSWVNITVLILTGSRRVIILLPISLLLLLAFWLKFSARESRSFVKSLYPILITSVAAALAIWISVWGMSIYMNSVYKVHGENGTGGFVTAETAPVQRYQTISDGSIFSKRIAIWSLAYDEIKTYSFGQMLIGKGSSYDIHLYDITKDTRVKESYGEKDVKGQLSAHNFLLADMLNGGLVKLALSLSICFVLIYYLWCLLVNQTFNGIFYLLFAAAVMLGSFISNRYGFIYDRYFWLLCAGIIGELGNIHRSDTRLEGRK